MNPLEVKRKQIEICAAAIGLITLLIFGELLGDNGVAYLAVSSECFLLLWSLTGSATADALAKLLRGRIARGQHKNAVMLNRIAMSIVGMAGVLCSVLLILLAEQIARNLFHAPRSAILIKLLAPAVCLRTFSALLLGRFQGDGMEMPAVIGAVLRQVCVLLFGLLFCNLLRGYGDKVSALLRQSDFTAMYGGMGIALGVSLTELLVLLLFILLYEGNRGKAQKTGGVMRTMDSYGTLLRMLYGSLTPAALASALRVLPLLTGAILYRRSCETSAELDGYGVFYGKYMALCGIIILPVYAMLLGSCVKTVLNLRKAEQRYARNHFWGGFHVGTAHALFWTVFFAVLAPQLAGIFCKSNRELAEQMLCYGSALVLLAILSAYFSELLRQMVGRYWIVGILVLYNVLFFLCLTLMLNVGGLGIMALVDAGLLAELLYAVVSGALVCLQIRCGIDWLRGLAVPAGAACVTGLILMFVSKAIVPHLGSLVTVIVCLAGSVILYWGILFALHNFRKQDMSYLPGGNLARTIGKWLRIL